MNQSMSHNHQSITLPQSPQDNLTGARIDSTLTPLLPYLYLPESHIFDEGPPHTPSQKPRTEKSSFPPSPAVAPLSHILLLLYFISFISHRTIPGFGIGTGWDDVNDVMPGEGAIWFGIQFPISTSDARQVPSHRTKQPQLMCLEGSERFTLMNKFPIMPNLCVGEIPLGVRVREQVCVFLYRVSPHTGCVGIPAIFYSHQVNLVNVQFRT